MDSQVDPKTLPVGIKTLPDSPKSFEEPDSSLKEAEQSIEEPEDKDPVSVVDEKIIPESVQNEVIEETQTSNEVVLSKDQVTEPSTQNLEAKPADATDEAIPGQKKMELRSNNSTDDLLSLESANGINLPQQPQGLIHPSKYLSGSQFGLMPSSANSLSVYASAVNSVQSSVNTTPLDTPRTTPSSQRKVKPALKLNLEESTWTQPQKPTRSAKIRKNFQFGAAKVNAVVQHSRTPEFRFRMVLVLLFGCIISMVTFTWYLYQRQMLQLTIGDKIRFLETKRVLHLLKGDGKEVLHGELGLHIPPELEPYDCQFLPKHSGPNICMEWKYRARLKIHFIHDQNVSCYAVHWQSLSKGTLLKDCFDLRRAHWYGMGELRNASWPLHGISIKMQPMVTGDLKQSDFGSILERYWLSSSGVGIKVEPDVPLFVSLNATGDDNLCFESHFEEFPYKTPKQDNLPSLQYTICTGSDAKIVHESMLKQFAELPTNINDTDFLQAPLWATWPKLQNAMTQEALQNYSHHIVAHGFDDQGIIVLDPGWQNQLGDLEFNVTNIPAPLDILGILQNKGFRILLTVHPYVCLDSKTFHNGTSRNYFVSDTYWKVPLLTRWPDSSTVCAIVDLTRNASANWFINRLKDLKMKYKIDGFYFVGGQSTYLPHTYHFNQPSVNPDVYLQRYADVASQVAPVANLSFAFKSQNKLSYIRLSPRTSTWDSSRGLQSIIPTVLNIGMLGYPLINPGSVGGDELFGNQTLPDNELYLRWLQMAVFLPVLQFSFPPADYDLREMKVAKVLLKTRKERVFPVMQRCLQEFITTGAPIVRPLWWLAPEDPITYGLETQFAIGDEIIVAPVTEAGKRNREVYLPKGFWKDEIQATTWRGERWHHNYSVPLDKLAYFIRTEDPKQLKDTN